MSFYRAERGEKRYLRSGWSSTTFIFSIACLCWGRNDAVFIVCYRRHRDGEAQPDDRELRALVKEANRVTHGLNADGEAERYTLYEARATRDQVAGYAEREGARSFVGKSLGINPLVERLRRRARTSRSPRATPPVRRLALAMADVADGCSSHEFSASCRQLAEMAGMTATAVSTHRHAVEALGWARKAGETAPWGGRERGTTVWSIKPKAPEQRVDEMARPTFDYRTCRWTWEDPEDRGRKTWFSWWRDRRASEAVLDSLPNVNSHSSSIQITSDNAFYLVLGIDRERGSPLDFQSLSTISMSNDYPFDKEAI